MPTQNLKSFNLKENICVRCKTLHYAFKTIIKS